MDSSFHKENAKSRYFGNVKSRLGSKLPAGVSQPPQFAKRPWDTQPQARLMHETSAGGQRQHQPIVCRPLNHIPHIRNPKLRQYYLQGTSWDLCNAVVTTEHAGVSSSDSTSSRCLPRDMAFGLSLKPATIFSAEKSQMYHTSLHTTQSSSSLIPSEQLLMPTEDKTSVGLGSSPPKLDLGSAPEQRSEVEAEQSSSPEAEYDKLLDVEAVSMPDGQLCLLALPPECCQEEEGPEALPYLKLVCRYITDGKGVVSGILLVTSNKIFFDPCKTHPLVKEHGCEEYLLSCSVDNLASVAFFSDISNVHFNTSQQRKKRNPIIQKMKSVKSCTSGLSKHRGLTHAALGSGTLSDLSGLTVSLTKSASEEEEGKRRDMAKLEQSLDNSPLGVLSDTSVGGLGVTVLSSATTFCCRGQEAGSQAKMDLLHSTKASKSSVENPTSVSQRSSTGSPGSLMFVRLRLQPSSGKKTVAGGYQFGSTKTSSKSDAWLALLQECADKLYIYLTHCRPDVCILEEGEDEGTAEPGEEEFVLIEDKEEDKKDEEEQSFQRHCSSVDDWEMVLMEDSGEKPRPVPDREPEGLNNIVENSQILEASHVRELCKELPARTVGHTWQLAYSTSCHGASLKSLYRKVNSTDSPMLIVIKDALDEIFGAFLSHPLKPSEAFYGTGETFLFMLHPRFKCFKWTGENSFFIKGDLDCFAIGGGSGHFGLWVDENLYLGHSSPCYTFNNCCLSETDDFRVMELEVWTFS